jgi:glycosyltransferase involved in cell wall biosynthesis
MDKRINQLGHDNTTIKRITWGIDPVFFNLREKRQKARLKLYLNPNCCVFFSPRANKPLYRIDHIIRSFETYLQKGGDGYLLVAEMYGDANTHNELKGLIQSSSTRRKIRFIGTLNTLQMQDCYAAADVVISYATTDGLPQTLLETMAAHCFPVFTDLPQYYSILEHKVNCFLCSDKLGHQLEDGFKYAADAYSNEHLLNTNWERCKQIANRDDQIEKMNDIYNYFDTMLK